LAITSKKIFLKITNLVNKKPTPKTTKWLGVIFAFSAAIFAGTFNVVGKTLVDPQYMDVTSLNPINLAVVLGLVTGLFFTPFAKNKTSPRKINRKTLFFIILLGITDVLAVTTNFFGLVETTASNASILTNIEVVFVVLIAIAIFQERLSKHEMLPMTMIIVGAVFLPLGVDLYGNNFGLDNLVYGDFLILLAAGFYALDISIARYLSRRASAARISQLSAFAAVPFALMLVIIFQIPFDIQIEHIPSILFIGIFITGLAYYFFILALRFIGAIRTILIYSTFSIFGVIFAGIFLGEEITILDVFSLGIVGLGVYLLRHKLAHIEQ